eukprot:357839-Chlamydomonas_euryale.AAC.11
MPSRRGMASRIWRAARLPRPNASATDPTERNQKGEYRGGAETNQKCAAAVNGCDGASLCVGGLGMPGAAGIETRIATAYQARTFLSRHAQSSVTF